MTSPLNPRLYRLLQDNFGTVKIASPGEAMIAQSVREPVSDRPMLAITHSGEYYRLCCPYCNDTRYRLYVNHMYGQKDRFGRRMKFLAVCYNETACMAKRENQDDF